jgi:ketosteroid isomerase-like protein
MTDRDEITNLIGRYCRGVSDLDVDEWGATWAEDARWFFTGADPIEGRAAIVEKFAEIRSLYPLCVQQVTSSVIDVKGDTGTGTGWVQVCEMQWRSDGKTAELIGDYHDEYVRTAEGWQFASRRFELRVSGPTSRAARLRS